MKTIKNLTKTIYLLIETWLSDGSIKANEEKIKNRLEICNACDEIRRDSHFLFFKRSRCGECGCYLKEKTKFEFEECPLKKW